MENKYNLPESLFRAIQNDNYSSGGSDFTTTELISPPQIVALKKRYGNEIQEDASERIWTLLGQSIHAILERAAMPENSIVEKRYHAVMNGAKISGQVDIIQNNTLGDWKITSTWVYIYGSRLAEWEQQGNINRWLAHKNGVEINKLENYLILRDWIKSKAGGNYPPIQFVTVPLRLWPLDVTESYIRERVILHQQAQKATDQELAQKFGCTKEDRWWNEKKQEFIRCKDWCSVSEKCQQYKGEK